MRGRGMAVVLIPYFGGHFGQSFSGDVSVIQAVQPDNEILALAFRQRHHIVFVFRVRRHGICITKRKTR